MFSHAQTVFIVAGGPSLIGFDWDRLAGRAVVAINRANEVLPQAKILWWSDWRFEGRHAVQLSRHAARFKASFASREKPDQRLPGVRLYQTGGLSEFSTVPGTLGTGNNGGYAALNLTVQLGAKQVVLLGYDLKLGEDGRGHWHEEHEWGMMKARTLSQKMAVHFPVAAKACERLGVKVFNATPGSALSCFETTTIEDALYL